MIRDVVFPGLKPLETLVAPSLALYPPISQEAQALSLVRDPAKLVHPQTIHILLGTGSVSLFHNKAYRNFLWPKDLIVWFSVKRMA